LKNIILSTDSFFAVKAQRLENSFIFLFARNAEY